MIIHMLNSARTENHMLRKRLVKHKLISFLSLIALACFMSITKDSIVPIALFIFVIAALKYKGDL